MEALLTRLKEVGAKLKLKEGELSVSAPPGALTASDQQALREHKQELIAMLQAGSHAAPGSEIVLQHRPEERFQPFPLTELQHSYWVGRSEHLEMGSIATHLYLEFVCQDLDLPRLNRALQALIARHEMLRAIVQPDGEQRILAEVPNYEIPTEDVRRCDAATREAAVLRTRNELSHQVLKADQWPLFDIRATQVDAREYRLHVSLDLLILDAFSMFVFFREWRAFYDRGEWQRPAPAVSFRDYVLAERTLAQTDAYRRAESYWQQRLPSLPPAPDLPLRQDRRLRKAPRFSRREARIDSAGWSQLEARARARGLTPSGLLMALYSEVLVRWSAAPHFTLNVTVSNRLPLHPDLGHVIGDFTQLTLVEVQRQDSGLSFLQFAQQLQKSFMQDLEQSAYPGVRVMQDWNKLHQMPVGASMPVVFSSGLIRTDDVDVGDLAVFGEKVFSVSQTSQVWLDHHVMELQGDLVLIWDAAAEVFEPGVVDAMFGAYVGAVQRCIDDPNALDQRELVRLPPEMSERREVAKQTAAPTAVEALHAGFVRNALERGSAAAVIEEQRTLSYQQVLSAACAVAESLRSAGAMAGAHVAVMMDKCAEQIVAALGILLNGGVFVPVDASLPRLRRQELLSASGARHVLVRTGADELISDIAAGESELGAPRALCVDLGTTGALSPALTASLGRSTAESAYVIFTSGTTGTPKGVVITHAAAMNTIAAVNALLGAKASDRLLGVSSFSFDLSVYDTFGVFTAGGALVLPPTDRELDAASWQRLMLAHRVTLWNSAPQLMQMLVDSHTGPDAAPLRGVLLSGDFIPLDLPERVRRIHGECRVLALGGATEASIWSNYFEVGARDPSWASIPYGKGLPNQQLLVLDSALRETPDFARGRIFIGGRGLAVGYWNDPERTAAKFITHPETHERLYDTGDAGLYLPDGNVAILGRNDKQVKIRGHRVELGEIESNIARLAGVKQAAVLLTSGAGLQRRLVAWIETREGAVVSAAGVETHLRERLPPYMVPQHVLLVERLPLNTNGKLDHKALIAEFEATRTGTESVSPRDETESALLAAWSEVIPGVEMGVTDNFFDLGGDSVLATQLARAINERLPAFALEMHELFECLTIEALANLYRSRGQEKSDDGAPSALYARVEQDVQQTLQAAWSESARYPAASDARDVLLTGATGWVGSHVLLELLQRTTAQIYCVVRAPSLLEAHARVLSCARAAGNAISPEWADRIVPVLGDLREPGWAIAATEWRRLAGCVGRVFHFAASVGVLQDYESQRAVNVLALSTLLGFAVPREGRAKSVFVASPGTVCRRVVDGELRVHTEEAVAPSPQGLLSPYALSKWAAERVLVNASEEGLRVKLFRTAHALPSSTTGFGKAGDTYGLVLKLTRAAKVAPDWESSRVGGTPVDVLARQVVDCALNEDDYCGVINVDRDESADLRQIAEWLSASTLPVVPVSEWKQRCLRAALRLPDHELALAEVLFSDRGVGTAVDVMFTRVALQREYLKHEQHSGALPLSDYWGRVGKRLEV